MLQRLLDHLPYIKGLRKRIRGAGFFPAGSYHSPVPDQEEVSLYLSSGKLEMNEPTEVEFNRNEQLAILTKFQAYYSELPFLEEKNDVWRYYYNQSWFSYADAIFLYSFLRQTKPQRIIEVGSGFSSAVMLDTIEHFLVTKPEIIFIDPSMDRLKSLLRPGDETTRKIIQQKVQTVPVDTFRRLESGDLLFVDSSHVVKCGSDLQFLMFEVLPQLATGVFVHFHDIFYPLEYPEEWLQKGVYWNEIYFLRAFLANNSRWKIYFFNPYVSHVFKDYIAEKMPLCLKNTGGSLYIRKN